MTRICAHCGTEVEGEALFCPTCGQPMASGAEPELPPAPDWPDLPPRAAPGAPAVPAGEQTAAAPLPAADEPPEPAAEPAPAGAPEVSETEDAAMQAAPPPPTRAAELPATPATHAWEQPVSEQPVPPWRRGAAFRSGAEDAVAEPGAGAGAPESAPTTPTVPVRTPSTVVAPAGMVRVPTLLSDWCAGIGGMVAVVAMFLPWRVAGAYTSGWGLASGVNLLYTLVALGVLAVVFLPDLLPRVPQRALLLLSVGLVGVGIGLDRLGQPLTGAGGIVFLIATLGIALGGGIAQLGHDRPVGGPEA